MNILFDSIFSFAYKKNSSFENFSHHTHELIYFLTGEGTTKINNITYTYMPNNVCFTHIGDIRNNNCSKTTNYICIRFTGSSSLLNVVSGVYSCNDDEILSLFININKEYKNKNYNYYAMCNLLISQLLIKLDRCGSIENKDTDIYNLIKEIDNTMSFNKSVSEMACSVSYSYDHFRHKFKEITGQSPTSYIINKRIENACKLLLLNKYTCTEITMMCGFSSSSQFTNLFKKTIGITPKKYQFLNKKI